MTEKKAIENGYIKLKSGRRIFQETFKIQAIDIRKRGFKAYIVSSSKKVSIYVEEKYLRFKDYKDLCYRLESINFRRKEIFEEIYKLKTKENEIKNKISEMKEKYNF